MKLKAIVLWSLLPLTVICLGQNARKSGPELPVKATSTSPEPVQAAPVTQAPPADELKAVLAEMNRAGAGFTSLQADFDWETFDRLFNDTDIQKGQAYFRRKGNNVEALFNFFNTTSAGGKPVLAKQALFKDGKLSFYEPKINRVTEHEVGKTKSDVDAFMSLGLGGRGDDLADAFNVNWQGWETVDGVRTAKLEVTGKSLGIQKVFSRAILWIDPQRDIAVKQQFFQTSGDYRLTRYRNIKYNGKMSDDIFRLKTSGSTEIMHVQ